MLNNNIFIKVIDINDVIKNGKLLSQLKNLTLYGSSSGMKHSLSKCERSNERLDGKAIIAYHKCDNETPIAWSNYSREETDYIVNYRKSMGVYVQCYVSYNYRRQGIGTLLLKTAQELAGDDPICAAGWSNEAYLFFKKNLVKDIYIY